MGSTLRVRPWLADMDVPENEEMESCTSTQAVDLMLYFRLAGTAQQHQAARSTLPYARQARAKGAHVWVRTLIACVLDLTAHGPDLFCVCCPPGFGSPPLLSGENTSVQL